MTHHIDNTYLTGTGQTIYNVHDPEPGCFEFGCVIHAPTDPHQDWPTNWRDDLYLMERICPHGVGHPDLDDLHYKERAGLPVYGVHSCDGCCAPSVMNAEQRSRIRQFNAAFGEIKWIDDELDLIFASIDGPRPAMDHTLGLGLIRQPLDHNPFEGLASSIDFC